MKIYRTSRISLGNLHSQKICVLGYGSQGRAQALNLKDSGCDVVVGLRPQSSSFKKAKKDKILARPIGDALQGATLICFLLPDEFQKEVYDRYVQPILNPGMTLMFAHGFNLTYQRIVPPSFSDVFLIAPKGPGPKLREAYLKGDALPSLMAIHQDFSGHTKKLALRYAKASGCGKRGVFQTTVREETISDLFGEQTVLCGGVVELMKMAFETLTESGVSPEAAYFECFHEVKLIVDLLHERGISGMAKAISHYGGMTRGPRLVPFETKKVFKKILKEIKSGSFAKEWILENQKGLKKYKRLTQQNMDHSVEKTGQKIRRLIGY